MEPENLVIEQLKAIRASIEANGDRIDSLTDVVREDVVPRLGAVESNLEVVAGGLTKLGLHIEWMRAQVTAASTQASAADTGRARLEEKLDDVVKRLEALEAER